MTTKKPYLVHDADKQRQELETADPRQWEDLWTAQHEREQAKYQRKRDEDNQLLAWVGLVVYVGLLVGACLVAWLVN